MMQTAPVYALITYLIVNRAGLPPWNTRIDWISLAIDNWDLIDMTSLPLTREFVKKWYIPNKAWENHKEWVDGRSPYSDPLLVGIDRAKLKALANPKTTTTGSKGKGGRVRPLNEASPDSCYCEHQRERGAVFKNKEVEKYIPKRQLDEAALREVIAARERAVAESGLDLTKKQPKSVNKVRLGRRAQKKAAMAAAAEANGHQKEMEGATTTAPQEHTYLTTAVAAEASSDDEPVSEQMLRLADRFDEFVNGLRDIIKS